MRKFASLISWLTLGFLIAAFGIMAIVIISGCGHPTPPPPLVNGSTVPASVAPLVNHLVATSHPVVASVVQSIPTIVRAVTSVPPDLKPVSQWLDVFIVVGIVVAGVAAGLYFEVSAKLGGIIGAIALGVTLLSLFFRTTLWMAPWISGGIAIAALNVVIYEWVKNRKLIDSDITGALTPKVTPLFPDKAPKAGIGTLGVPPKKSE